MQIEASTNADQQATSGGPQEGDGDVSSHGFIAQVQALLDVLRDDKTGAGVSAKQSKAAYTYLYRYKIKVIINHQQYST